VIPARTITRALRTVLRALPSPPASCDVTAVPGAGTATIVVRDEHGRPLLTISALAAVYGPPKRGRRTFDEVAPRPELPAVPPLAVDPMAPGVRTLRVGDAVHPPTGDEWSVRSIGADGVHLALDDGEPGEIVVAPSAITLDTADLWRFCGAARVWIDEAAWDALSTDAREDFEEPIGGLKIDWRGSVAWVWARVMRDETLVTLRGLAEAHGVELVESEITPPTPVKAAKRAAKRARKAPVEPSTRCETPATTDAAACVRESYPIRALIVHDEGADSLGARKGLHAWSAEKTPGAGLQSGGENAPLVMLWTPATDSPDVAKLLARYAKVKRPVLDLGVIAGGRLGELAPSVREVRQRWNAAHPGARVDVPEVAKTAKKGAAK
jgi:hypothetical protein